VFLKWLKHPRTTRLGRGAGSFASRFGVSWVIVRAFCTGAPVGEYVEARGHLCRTCAGTGDNWGLQWTTDRGARSKATTPAWSALVGRPPFTRT